MPIATFVIALALQHSRGFAPDPRYPWMVQGLGLARREDDLLGYPEPLYPAARPASRYEYAVGRPRRRDLSSRET